LQGRCVSCDAKLDLRLDDQGPWPQPKAKMVPSSPWPHRGPIVPPLVAPSSNLVMPRPANWSAPKAREGTAIEGKNYKRHESLPALVSPGSDGRPLH
jgi:hypothetical protein